MTQRYFGMLFIFLFVALYIGLGYFVSEQKLASFVVIYVLCGFYAGQYSTRFPKE
jgi:uncharacterized membrane protein